MTERTFKACVPIAWFATVLGGILITGERWAGTLCRWLFDDQGEPRIDGVIGFFSKPLTQLYLMVSMGWFPGLILFFTGCVTLIFLYGSKCVGLSAVRGRPFTTTAISGAVLAHAVVVAISWPFFDLPECAEIRPMGWSLAVFLVSFLSLVIIVPIGIAAIIKERARFWGVASLIGGLTPFFTAISILSFAQQTKGLQMLS